ncbi:MAG: hypothetical protein NXH90_17855 [Flavobacteriaceae bacterium]|nr:hypothetical protein [Flavobacteriaceae bacterium]
MKLLPIHTKAIIGTITTLLVVLFVYTASSKLLDLGLFEWRLGRMPYIWSYANSLSWGVPLLELVIAGLLVVPKLRVLGLYASGILLTLFTTYVIAVLQFSDHIPCSCGGALSALGWDDHIVFNALFMALALVAIVLSKKQNKISNG